MSLKKEGPSSVILLQPLGTGIINLLERRIRADKLLKVRLVDAPEEVDRADQHKVRVRNRLAHEKRPAAVLLQQRHHLAHRLLDLVPRLGRAVFRQFAQRLAHLLRAGALKVLGAGRVQEVLGHGGHPEGDEWHGDLAEQLADLREDGGVEVERGLGVGFLEGRGDLVGVLEVGVGVEGYGGDGVGGVA